MFLNDRLIDMGDIRDKNKNSKNLKTVSEDLAQQLTEQQKEDEDEKYCVTKAMQTKDLN